MTLNFKSIITVFAIILAFTLIPLNSSLSFGNTERNVMFNSPATEFNLDLAKYTLNLSVAAYGDTPESINALLKSQGFTNDTIYDTNSYEKSSKMGNDLVGYTFANKNIKCDDKNYTLIAVVIRGTATDAEWASNFNINNSGNSAIIHEGFYKAEKELLSNLNKYISDLKIAKSNTKILVTGHSRGAAIANLLAADLSDEVKLASRSNIYGYTFATPNVAKIETNDNNYFNIFNAVNPVDIITELPLTKWGYGKYGVNYVVPDEKHMNTEALNGTTKLLKELNTMAPTVRAFYEQNLSVTFMQGDMVPSETSKAHDPQVYMEGLEKVTPKEYSEYVFDLQLKLIPDDIYA